MSGHGRQDDGVSAPFGLFQLFCLRGSVFQPKKGVSRDAFQRMCLLDDATRRSKDVVQRVVPCVYMNRRVDVLRVHMIRK